ncbi:MAG: hypothetical protein KGI51_09395 [Rhodospirillales bacterium]|nr:hypothetical protein [Rhodospirillales bacterium]
MRLLSSPSARRGLLSAMLGLGLALAPFAAAQAAKPKAPPHTSGPALHGYSTEAAAKTGCAGDTVVWRARGSKVFHTATSKYFGKTKHGSFVCEKAAVAKGLHAAKS